MWCLNRWRSCRENRRWSAPTNSNKPQKCSSDVVLNLCWRSHWVFVLLSHIHFCFCFCFCFIYVILLSRFSQLEKVVDSIKTRMSSIQKEMVQIQVCVSKSATLEQAYFVCRLYRSPLNRIKPSPIIINPHFEPHLVCILSLHGTPRLDVYCNGPYHKV